MAKNPQDGVLLSNALLLQTRKKRKSAGPRNARCLLVNSSRAVPARAAAGAVRVVDVVVVVDAARAAAAGVAVCGNVTAGTRVAQARAATEAG